MKRERNAGIFISVILIVLIGGFLIAYYNPTITGMVAGGGKYHYIINGSEIEIARLQLSYICSNESDVWRVFNENDIDIIYSWEEFNGKNVVLNGSGVAVPGKNYFSTPKIESDLKMKIFVQGVEHWSEKNKEKECEEDPDFYNESIVTTTTLEETTTLVEETTEIPTTIMDITSVLEETTEIITTLAPNVNNGGGWNGYYETTTTTKPIITTTKPISTTLAPTTTETITTITIPETLPENRGFFSLVGNAIRIPIEGVRNNAGLSIFILIILAAGGFFVIRDIGKRNGKIRRNSNNK